MRTLETSPESQTMIGKGTSPVSGLLHPFVNKITIVDLGIHIRCLRKTLATVQGLIPLSPPAESPPAGPTPPLNTPSLLAGGLGSLMKLRGQFCAVFCTCLQVAF